MSAPTLRSPARVLLDLRRLRFPAGVRHPRLLTPVVAAVGAAAVDAWAGAGLVQLTLVAVAAAVAGRQTAALGARAQAGQHRDERATLLHQVVVEADRSRRQLIAELHDGPLQRLVLAGMSLELGLDDAPVGVSGRRECTAALEHVQSAIGEVRILLAGRGGDHDDTGEDLAAALRRVVDQHAHAFPAGVSVLFAVDRPVPPDIRQAAYLIGREAIVNAVKHADAATLTVTGAATDTALLLTVADDGVGLDLAAATARAAAGHLGAALMAERAAAVGGTVTARPAPGGGTVVEVQLPLPERWSPVLPLPAPPRPWLQRAAAAAHPSTRSR